MTRSAWGFENDQGQQRCDHGGRRHCGWGQVGEGREQALRTIRDALRTNPRHGVAAAVIDRATRETALPHARLQGEIACTCAQLRLFAQVAEVSWWDEARIDPDCKPAPKPEIRSMLRPLGPIVVFGASNFPLAFSVAGGDTASALASGNPVIVKAHPPYPGTSELMGRAIRESVRESRLPEGTFSLIFDGGNEVGSALAKHPLAKAGGFTGSHAAGRILMDLAASRAQPIPFYAEMGSTNPLFILPGAWRERGEAVAAGLHASFTLGGGQFCTKPGVVVLSQGDDSSRFIENLRWLVQESSPFHVLTPGIHLAYDSSVAKRRADSAVNLVAQSNQPAEAQDFVRSPRHVKWTQPHF